MKRYPIAAMLILAVCMTVFGTGSTARAELPETRVITDTLGREVEIPVHIDRAVCVGVGALRYSCYVGAADRIIAVEEYETRPELSRLYSYVNAERFRSLPIIGGNGEPYPEELIAADPQVIVMSTYAKTDPDTLSRQTGIPVVAIPGSDTVLDAKAYETIRILGIVFGKEERAAELEQALDEIRQDLSRRTEAIPEEEKPTVYIAGVNFRGSHGFEGTEAYYGPLELIHARNLANTTGQSSAFDCDPEQVLFWDPDVIFMDYNGMDLIRASWEQNPDYYLSLKAVREGHIYTQISFRSFAANLDTALADAYYAGCVLYPDAFSDIQPEEKAGEIFELLLGINPYPDLKEAGYEFCAILPVE